MDKNELKVKLRDWMTATTQLLKVSNPHVMDTDAITFWWRSKFGIRMKSRWIEKALYGKKQE